MNIIIFLLILGILILVHELGHFIAAKKNGVGVEEFGIGFPPRIFSIKRGETIYSLNAIPIGGFVKLYGEEYHEKINPELKNKIFVNKKPWQKALIIIAGVLGNFLLGWLLISYLFIQGVPTPTNKIIVEKVQKNSPAAYAGLREKDIILKLYPPKSAIPDKAPNKTRDEIKPILLTSSSSLISLTKKYAGHEIVLEVQRNSKIFQTKLIPRANPPPGQGPLGITITSFVEKKYPWYQAPIFGLIEAANITKKIATEILKIVLQLFTFQKPQMEVAGPIGIAHFLSSAIKFGKNAVLELTALLSLNLAIINILPFPALDGGRLIFVIYEWITKKPVNKNLERYLNLVGIFILLTLLVFISINDIIRLSR